MSETTLPKELEDQVILSALGILDPKDHLALQMRIGERSQLLRQAVTAYQMVTDALATLIPLVPPPPTLRERLITKVTHEAALETEQFQEIANTLTLGLTPVRPPNALREQLFSQIKAQADLRAIINDVLPNSIWPISNNDSQLPKDTSDVRSHRRRLAWQNLIMASYMSYRICWTAFVTLLRVILVPSRLFSRSQAGRNVTLGQQVENNLTFIKASEGTWRDIAPGVTAKVLSFNPALRRMTTLLRLAPSSNYAPHHHMDTEELYVLQGGCSIAGRAMTIGDYHRAEAGTEHYNTTTDEGCMLLVISSPQNELLD